MPSNPPTPLTHHLAQANVALGRAPLTDPVMKGFVDQLACVNSVADRAPGFVWRYQTEYVFRSDHVGPLRPRKESFQRMERPHSVLWWVPAGVRPTVSEAEDRLERLRLNGPAPDAFTFATQYDPRGRPLVRSAAIDRECGV